MTKDATAIDEKAKDKEDAAIMDKNEMTYLTALRKRQEINIKERDISKAYFKVLVFN